MTAKEMLEVISNRRTMASNVFAKIDYMYEQTEKMFAAIEVGKDIDQCFEYWVTLIDKMESESKADKEYYNYHVTHLVSLVDEWHTAKRKADTEIL